jgi:hypothetical protein
MSADFSAYRLVDRTSEFRAIRLFAQLEDGASDVGRFATRIRNLPTFARTYTSHQHSVSLPGAEALLHTLRRLEGKFVVVNRARAAAIPRSVLDALAELDVSESTLGDSAQVVIALHEPGAVSVRHTPSAGPRSEPQHYAFSAIVPYRITVFVRQRDGKQMDTTHTEGARDPISTLDAGESRAVSEALDWFRVGLCIPDVDALRQMTSEAALFYRWITGRLGAGSTDRYWRLDEWEQYTEPGRIRGIVGPEVMTQARLSAATDRDPLVIDEDLLYGSESFSPPPSRWPRLSRHFDRRALVPPGYCLVDFTATLAAHVCTVGSRPG